MWGKGNMVLGQNIQTPDWSSSIIENLLEINFTFGMYLCVDHILTADALYLQSALVPENLSFKKYQRYT
jgi:hypothetical protein